MAISGMYMHNATFLIDTHAYIHSIYFLEVHLLWNPLRRIYLDGSWNSLKNNKRIPFCKVNKHWDTDNKKESVNEEASYGKFVLTEDSKSEDKYG